MLSTTLWLVSLICACSSGVLQIHYDSTMSAGKWLWSGSVSFGTETGCVYSNFCHSMESSASINKLFDTSGYSDIYMMFDIVTTNYESSDFCWVLYSADNGTNYIELNKYTSQNAGEHRRIYFPRDANDNSNFRVKFENAADAVGEKCIIDDVFIYGTSPKNIPYPSIHLIFEDIATSDTATNNNWTWAGSHNGGGNSVECLGTMGCGNCQCFQILGGITPGSLYNFFSTSGYIHISIEFNIRSTGTDTNERWNCVAWYTANNGNQWYWIDQFDFINDGHREYFLPQSCDNNNQFGIGFTNNGSSTTDICFIDIIRVKGDVVTSSPTLHPILTPTNPSSSPTLHPTISPTAAAPSRTPTTQNPTTAKPTTQNPTTAVPTTDEPTTSSPTTSNPTTNVPTTAIPTTTLPTTANPTSSDPTTDKPTTGIPTTSSPTPKEERNNVTIIIGGDTTNLEENKIMAIITKSLNISSDDIISTKIEDGSIKILISTPSNIALSDDTIKTKVEDGLVDEYGDDLDISVNVTQTDNKEIENTEHSSISISISDTKMIIFMIVMAVLTIICCILLIIFYSKKKKEKKLIEKQHALSIESQSSAPNEMNNNIITTDTTENNTNIEEININEGQILPPRNHPVAIMTASALNRDNNEYNNDDKQQFTTDITKGNDKQIEYNMNCDNDAEIIEHDGETIGENVNHIENDQVIIGDDELITKEMDDNKLTQEGNT